ncbi:MAG: RHS repeat-associated core domain-containing protein [Candidatus Acidiferrales bacterium]
MGSLYSDSSRLTPVSDGAANKVAYRILRTFGKAAVPIWFAGAEGTGAQALAYGPYGRRRDAADWSSVLSAAQLANLNLPTRRGYTGGESLDVLGAVVLGALVYVPALARFLSPDPAGMGSPYVYVGDNSESDVDPTGELNWNSVGKIVEAVVIAVAAYFTGGAVLEAGGTTVEAGAAGGFVAGFAGSGGNLEDGAIGALGGAAMGYFGGITGGANPTEGQLFERGVAEGLVGGTLSTVATHGANGSFASGFLGAFAAAYVGGGIYPNSESGTAIALRTAAMAVVGGTAAEIGGGSFANGAISAAFQQLFNQAADAMERRRLDAEYLETPAEKQAFAKGNLGAFYLMRIEQGDRNSVALIGLAMWGTAAETAALPAKWLALAVAGKVALISAIGYNPGEMHAIGVQLAAAYVNEVTVDVNTPLGNKPGVLAATQVFGFHDEVFSKFHISMAYFGGTIFTGNPLELKATAPFWCPNCDTNAQPGGG